MAERKEVFDGMEIGLAQPAIRALHDAGINRLEELAGWLKEDIACLHGMGPKGVASLKAALQARGKDFARGNY